jgi:hypothetical protein
MPSFSMTPTKKIPSGNHVKLRSANLFFRINSVLSWTRVSEWVNWLPLIANQVDANPEHCLRAAQLSKCDLLTNMVGEFADLQGLMGSYYAEYDGEPGRCIKGYL